MFVDLDWPLNASSLLSASAELLVTSQHGLDCRYDKVCIRRRHCNRTLMIDAVQKISRIGVHIVEVCPHVGVIRNSPVVETRQIHLGRNKMKQANFKEFYTWLLRYWWWVEYLHRIYTHLHREILPFVTILWRVYVWVWLPWILLKYVHIYQYFSMFFLLIYVNISSRFQIICTLTLIILTWKSPI